MYYLIHWKNKCDEWLIITEGNNRKECKIIKVLLNNHVDWNGMSVPSPFKWRIGELYEADEYGSKTVTEDENIEKLIEKAMLEIL